MDNVDHPDGSFKNLQHPILSFLLLRYSLKFHIVAYLQTFLANLIKNIVKFI